MFAGTRQATIFQKRDFDLVYVGLGVKERTRLRGSALRASESKDRFAMLSPVLLEFLRDWYRIARPAVWLLSGRDRLRPLTTRQLS